MPHLIIIAGCNGSGKTTSAPALLKEALDLNNFVNADTIAQGLCAFQPEKMAIQAGRIMLDQIHALAIRQEDFSFETTLASRTFSTWIPKLKEQGYQFHLIFLWLQSPELAISRVKERVKLGGHHIPTETIKRRYEAGLRNFFNLYTPLTDSWQLYNNSDAKIPSLIASQKGNTELIISNQATWQTLLETYHES